MQVALSRPHPHPYCCTRQHATYVLSIYIHTEEDNHTRSSTRTSKAHARGPPPAELMFTYVQPGEIKYKIIRAYARNKKSREPYFSPTSCVRRLRTHENTTTAYVLPHTVRTWTHFSQNINNRTILKIKFKHFRQFSESNTRKFPEYSAKYFRIYTITQNIFRIEDKTNSSPSFPIKRIINHFTQNQPT